MTMHMVTLVTVYVITVHMIILSDCVYVTMIVIGYMVFMKNTQYNMM